jgi:hypothetical protein
VAARLLYVQGKFIMQKSNSSAITESGNHRCTRKSAACEQGVCICRPLPAQDSRPISPVEYFALAVQYAKERGMRSIPVPMDIATSVLEALRNPPQESLGQTTCICGTRLDHPSEAHECPPPLEVTSVSFAEEQKRTRPMRPSAIFDASLKDAGRGWHQGM